MTMQINREEGNIPNAITAYAAGEIRMRERVFRASLIATRNAVIPEWNPAPVEQLAIDDFARLLELAPDVVILGTGPTQRMPPPELFAMFAARGIGLEVMDTGAACRTYNLLLSEFREVAIALTV
jgi:uncharacterized protein